MRDYWPIGVRIAPSLSKAKTSDKSAHKSGETLLRAQWTVPDDSCHEGKLAFTFRDSGDTVAATPGLVPDKAEKMCAASAGSVSKLLVMWGQGDLEARDALIPLVYDELRRVARRHLGRERPDHTMQSAALVHEAYLRLVHQEPPQWRNRAHFFGVAAQLMRHLLVDHARNRRAAKRGAGAPRVTLDAQIVLPQRREVDFEALDDALNKLAGMDLQQSRVIEL